MPWQVIFIGWLIFVIVPLILGLARMVELKWVLLWEAVMFSPVLLIMALFFVPRLKGIDTKKVRDMYIPKVPGRK